MRLSFRSLAEQQVQGIDGVDGRELAAADEGDAAGLLADHDHVGVALLGDADGGLVAHAEPRREVGALRDREGAAGGDDAVAGDDHGAVVERGVLEEDVHDQAPADLGVHHVAGGDDVLQGILLLDDDERSLLLRGHLPAGFGDLLQGAGVHPAAAPAGEHLLQERLYTF